MNDFMKLIKAMEGGNTAAVDALIKEAGVDVNAKDELGSSPLMFAESPEMVTLLIEAGADVNAKNDYGYTPLIFAAENSSTSETVTLLLEKGADVNARTNGGSSALVFAIGNPLGAEDCNYCGEAFMALVNGGIDLLSGDSCSWTPLHVAVAYRHEAAVRYLVAKGVDVNSKDCYGTTSLMAAVRHTNASIGIVKLLLEKGADVNSKDNRGRSALCLAKECAGPSIVQLLS